MNILYIHSHDSGRYLSPYWEHAPTPNIKALAKRGTAFTDCHTVSPTCSPSRACMLTGTYPPANGMIGLAHFGHKLDTSLHIANYLKNIGYQTVLCGVQHETSESKIQELGYEKVFISPSRKDFDEFDSYAADRATEFLKGYDGKNPFFLSVGFLNTHRPFPDVDCSVSDVILPEMMVDSEVTRQDFACYLESARRLDSYVGRVLNALYEAHLEDDTIVIFTTDHGIAFPGMKCNLTANGTGVALILDFKGNPKKGETIDALVSQVDIFPTICELINAPAPAHLQGKSLLPLFYGEHEINDYIYTFINYHVAYQPMRGIRSKRFNYILSFFDNLPPCNTDDGPSKEYYREIGYFEREYPKEQLYDVQGDECEKTNLAYDLSYEGIKEQMRKALLFKLEEIDDPILRGKVIRPAGTISYRQDAYCVDNKYREID